MADSLSMRTNNLTRGRPIRSGANNSATHVDVPGLSRARLAAGLSQRALAEAAGLSEHSLSAWERGRRRAPRSVLPALAKTLRVSMARLLR